MREFYVDSSTEHEGFELRRRGDGHTQPALAVIGGAALAEKIAEALNRFDGCPVCDDYGVPVEPPAGTMAARSVILER